MRDMREGWDDMTPSGMLANVFYLIVFLILIIVLLRVLGVLI